MHDVKGENLLENNQSFVMNNFSPRHIPRPIKGTLTSLDVFGHGWAYLAGHNTGFEFMRQYECIKSLDHHKRQKILQTDRSFVFLCCKFSLDKYALL